MGQVVLVVEPMGTPGCAGRFHLAVLTACELCMVMGVLIEVMLMAQILVAQLVGLLAVVTSMLMHVIERWFHGVVVTVGANRADQRCQRICYMTVFSGAVPAAGVPLYRLVSFENFVQLGECHGSFGSPTRSVSVCELAAITVFFWYIGIRFLAEVDIALAFVPSARFNVGVFNIVELELGICLRFGIGHKHGVLFAVEGQHEGRGGNGYEHKQRHEGQDGDERVTTVGFHERFLGAGVGFMAEFSRLGYG